MIIDTHAHLDGFYKKNELDAVLRRASANGVEKILAIGTDTDDWPINHDLAAQFPGLIYQTIGLHPCHVGEDWETRLGQMHSSLHRRDGLVAIGEAGLDYFRLPKENKDEVISWQKEAFRQQILIAKDFNLPLVVHSRAAFGDTLKILQTEKFPADHTVFHCFAEGPGSVRELNAWGARASFTGIPTFPKADDVKAALKAQPIELLMIETDCPYLAPQAVRGQKNEPAFLQLTAQWMANFLGIAIDDFNSLTTSNAVEFFSLDKEG